MADIPYGTYNVQLSNASNNWANGALVYNASGVTYKGNSVTNFNTSTTNVSWNVTLSHGGNNNCPLAFSGGQYSVNSVSNKGQIKTGTVTGGCIVAIIEDPQDTWSADAVSTEGHPLPRKAGA